MNADTIFSLIATVVSLVTLVVVVAGLRYASEQVGLVRTQLVEDFRWKRSEKALEYSFHRTDVVRNARGSVYREFGNPTGHDEPISLITLQDAFKRDPQVEEDLITLLAHVENIALAIHSELIDEEVVYHLVAATCVAIMNAFSEFIEHRGAEQPSYLSEAKLVMGRWQERRASGDLAVMDKLPEFPTGA